MTITLTACRKADILEVCSNLLKHNSPKIRCVSTVIGMVIAALPGVQHGALHYRILESEKTAALHQNGGDYNKRTTLSPLATMEIQWWLTKINSSCHFIHAPPPDTIIYSDASLDGWGATNSLTTVGSPWDIIEELPHQCFRTVCCTTGFDTLGSTLPGFPHS